MNNKIQLAYYKAPGKFFDKLVRFWDKHFLGGEGKYSHVEIHFGGNLFFSADAWENKVRFRHFTPNPDNWDFQDVEITPAQFETMLNAALAEEEKKYSFHGIARFVIPFIPPCFSRWFCSQICTYLLQPIGLYTDKKPEDMTPGMMYQI